MHEMRHWTWTSPKIIKKKAFWNVKIWDKKDHMSVAVKRGLQTCIGFLVPEGQTCYISDTDTKPFISIDSANRPSFRHLTKQS